MENGRHGLQAQPRIRIQNALGGRAHPGRHQDRRRMADIYVSDHPYAANGGAFRWLLTTSLPAAAGALAIVVVILTSIDRQDRWPSVAPDGLRWAVAKADRLPMPGGAMAVAFTIPERVRERRQGREFIFDRMYHRLEARLAPVAKPQAASIPPLDPPSLYVDTGPIVRAGKGAHDRRNATVKVIDLFGGTLPAEDGQDVELREVEELVAHMLAAEKQGGLEPVVAEEGLGDPFREIASEPDRPNISNLAKSALETGDSGDHGADPYSSSLYASLVHAAQTLGMPPELIQQVLKTHAFTTDFSQSVRAGDGFEFLFDGEGDKDSGQPWNLVASTMTSSRGAQRFYRFRTADGTVDYYDEQGGALRKFLMRQPVRCGALRIASGYGQRLHPLLQIVRLHTGIDWACPEGTPIMAAGGGSVEDAGRRGEYGNYIRLRHMNGYATAYAHLSRFAPGLSRGATVRQGQIIGYVGSSGFSSGPHVHFEVMIKGSDRVAYRHIDPLSLSTPHERELTGRDLADFQIERARIDRLLRADPISTRVAMGRM